MDIISRAEWGARAPRNRQAVSWSQRREVVVHYSEGPTTQTPRSIQDFHMGPSRGWADIGYNFLVDVEGRIYEGRGWLTVGAHAPGHNTSGIGVCMIGRDGDATPAAKRSIRWLYDVAGRHAGRSLKKLGHRDVYSTSCPGDQLYAWVRAGMPAPGSEDDMPLTDKDVEKVAAETVKALLGAAYNRRGHTVGVALETAHDGVLQLLARDPGAVDVDEQAIAEAVLAGLTPEKIAAAVIAARPADEARQVINEMAARLAAGTE